MIQPERFSDLHETFEVFRKVTGVWHVLKFARNFLRQNKLVPPRLTWVLLLVAFLPTVWIVHFFVPLSVMQVLAVPNDIWVWLSWVLLGMITSIVFLVIGDLICSNCILRRMKDKGLVDNKPTSFRAEIQRLILQEFTDYLARKGFYNLEALSQLIENTRDEIEARWRPIPLLLTLITLAVALVIAYFQPVFSQFLQNQFLKNPQPDIRDFFIVGVSICLFMLIVVSILFPNSLLYLMPIGSSYLSLRSERAIYLHCLSDIRLSLLKTVKVAEYNSSKFCIDVAIRIEK